jgi:hypothetical protein
MTWWTSKPWLDYEAAYQPAIPRAQELAAATWQTRVIDLQRTEAELWQGVRKSYKSIIHKAEREYIITQCPPVEMREFAKMHHEESGRSTRPDETWSLMEQFVRDGHLTLIAAVAYQPHPPNLSNGYAAFAAFYQYGDWAYYGHAASRITSLQHALIWTAIRVMRGRGVKRLELGWQGQATDDKGRAIEFFRTGFGGYNCPANFLVSAT